MSAIRKIQTVGEEGKLLIEVPKEFGGKVEIILLPAPDKFEESPGEGSMIREGMERQGDFSCGNLSCSNRRRFGRGCHLEEVHQMKE